MKNHLKLIVVTFLICAVSCESGIEDLETEATDISKSTQQGPSAAEILESYLQVTAFITAEVLYQADPNNNLTDQLVLSEFENALTTPNDPAYSAEVRVVNLDYLLGPNSQTPNFENAFAAKFDYYRLNNLGDPLNCPKGDHPNITCPGCFTNLTYQGFIDVVISENCIELYLPNGYNTSNLNRFNTTAHPMNITLDNSGWEIPAACEDDLAIEIGSVDASNFDSLNNLIVARPFKNMGSVYCTYASYSNIDFTNYLFN